MNNVHEQCPNNDSEIVLRQKLVKCIVCTHTAQPARLGAHRRAQAHARLVVLWCPPTPCFSQGPAVSWPVPTVSQRAPTRPCALCRACRGLRPCAPCRGAHRVVSQAPHRRIVAICRVQVVVSQACAASWLAVWQAWLAMLRHSPSLKSLSPVAIHLGVLRYKRPAASPLRSLYTTVYRDTTLSPSSSACHDIKFVL